MHSIQLSDNWQCKQHTAMLSPVDDASDENGWFAASVPGTVHQALLASKQIPDPFYGRNETLVQWVGESDWLYRCTFERPDVADGDCVVLCFDGLDTFASVWLNGEQILHSDNMFIPYRIDVASQLREGTNELLILFESALRLGKEREAEYGKLAVWNGDASRVYVRKAQYHYGWDWGPTLLTAGPWQPVYLEVYSARIADLYCPVELEANLERARIHVQITCEVSHASRLTALMLSLNLYAPDGTKIDEQTLPVTDDVVHATFVLDNPQLWWPRGYGEQPLYRIEAVLRQQAQVLDRNEKRVGMRHVQLVQRPVHDGNGTTFFFSVNNTPIFCGGANWIPADSFLPAVTPERYRTWLQYAADANMTMLRVWGGGIYENDVFYDICDELGLLVWQDFLFGCGIYPAHEEFQKSVEAEAEAALLRLRHHPSIVLWCGNNEDYSIAQSKGLYDSSFTGNFTTTQFPARAIYERLLPEVCARLDPERPYWPGSPYDGSDANSTEQGDTHAWHIWGGDKPYQDYPETKARFVSEFGMGSLPALSTIEGFTLPEERYPQSRTIEHHNKSDNGARKLTGYIIDNVRIPADLPGYIYATQFIQAEAMGLGIRSWRRHWGHLDEQTGGALLWQLDDCWPVSSWAIIDYAFRPKPAYYAVKRELAPLVVGLARVNGDFAEVWAVNGLMKPVEARVNVSVWTLDGKLVAEEHLKASLDANQGTELGRMHYDEQAHIVSARLLLNGETVARATLWPEPYKYLTLPDPEITVERLDAHTLRVEAKRPAKGVWLTAHDGVQWSDNMLDLLPNEAQIIKVHGLGNGEIQVQWLGKDVSQRQ